MAFLETSKGLTLEIDDEFEAIIKNFSWCSCPRGYAHTKINKKTVLLHRLICGVINEPLVSVDHINGDRFNNRLSNLRLCSHQENMRNRAIHKNNKCGFKGVTLLGGKYKASIRRDGRTAHLGWFGSPEEAAAVYDIAARELHGEFARLNFPGESA